MPHTYYYYVKEMVIDERFLLELWNLMQLGYRT